MDCAGDKILTVLVIDAIGMCHLAKLVVEVGFTNANYLSHIVGAALQMPVYLSFDMRYANMSNSKNNSKNIDRAGRRCDRYVPLGEVSCWGWLCKC